VLHVHGMYVVLLGTCLNHAAIDVQVRLQTERWQQNRLRDN
jgi:hypothetical protein